MYVCVCICVCMCLYMCMYVCVFVFRLGVENEFWINSPLPQVNFELRSTSKGIFSGGKIAKVSEL